MSIVDNKADIERILETCIEIEQCNADLYRYFARIFADFPGMAKLWEKTAQEEDNHANQFILAIKLRKLKVIDDVASDIINAGSFLTLVKSISEGVKIIKPGRIDALVTALDLEEKLAAFHANGVAHFVDESYKKLFTAMMKADRNHIVLLQKAYQKLTAGSAHWQEKN